MSQNPPKHGPNRLQTYIDIHQTVIEQLKDIGFVGPENIQLIVPSRYFCFLTGEIGCLGGIVIRVEKKLDILEGFGANALVQTVWYSYNASIRGERNILRYDNQDEDPTFRGHPDPHHKHIFDWQTGDELDIKWVGEQNWPKLNEVIEELHAWYWENQSFLANPDSYPEIGLR